LRLTPAGAEGLIVVGRANFLSLRGKSKGSERINIDGEIS